MNEYSRGLVIVVHVVDCRPITRANRRSLVVLFPDSLKIAKVCSVFKIGDKCQFTNYRPTSVLPRFSKVFEKVVSNRMLAFLESENILFDNQFGFRKNRSTSMAILDTCERISHAIDNHEFAICAFIDLSKAFDNINHSILIRKLEYYGFRGVAFNWFRSYSNSGQQYVFLNGVSSSLKLINCDVPQG